MKAIHKIENWKKMPLAETGRTFIGALACALAPCTKEGDIYPPILWETICAAFDAVSREDRETHLPQVWTRANNDHGRVVGVVWEICAKHEYGTFDEYGEAARDKINALVCEVRTHLGTNYNQFVIS